MPSLTLAQHSLARENKPSYLPSGTKMRSSHGVIFVVDICVEHTGSKYFVPGIVTGATILSRRNLDEVSLSDVSMIETALFHPTISWAIIFLPGFQPLVPVEYKEKVVQPLYNTWANKQADDRDITVNMKRKSRAPNEDNAIHVPVKRYQKWHMQDLQIIDMSGHSTGYVVHCLSYNDVLNSGKDYLL